MAQFEGEQEEEEGIKENRWVFYSHHIHPKQSTYVQEHIIFHADKSKKWLMNTDQISQKTVVLQREEPTAFILHMLVTLSKII